MNSLQIARNAEVVVYDSYTNRYVVGTIVKILKNSFDVELPSGRVVRFVESGDEYGSKGRGSRVHFRSWNETTTAQERVDEKNARIAERNAEKARQQEAREEAEARRNVEGWAKFHQGRVQTVPTPDFNLYIWTTDELNHSGSHTVVIAKDQGEASWGGGRNFAISGSHTPTESLGATYANNVADYREAIASYLAVWG
jgi:hypothetical protein